MIFTCKQTSKVLEEEHLRRMSPIRRALVCFHLSWCPICKKYNKHVIQMQDATDALQRLEEREPNQASAPHLSEDCRCRINSLLQGLMDDSQHRREPGGESSP